GGLDLTQALGPLLLDRVGDLPPRLGDPAQVGLQDLADVHAAGDTERVQDDVDRSAVRQEWHVLDRQDLGDDALVAVTPGELVTGADLALLRHVHADELVDARAELVTLGGVEDADADHGAGLAVRSEEHTS